MHSGSTATPTAAAAECWYHTGCDALHASVLAVCTCTAAAAVAAAATAAAAVHHSNLRQGRTAA
jgi:hypothetical protein